MVASRWVLVFLLCILAILCLDRLLLKLEERGWIYYRKRHASPGGLGGAFIAVQSMLEPGAKHVLEYRQSGRAGEDEAGGAPDPWQGPWVSCAASQYAGCTEARINTGAAPLAGNLSLRDQAVVVIRCQQSDADETPSDGDSTGLSVTRERVMELLQSDKESICVAVLTGPNLQRLVFYTSSPESVESRITALRPAIHPHEILLRIQEDDEWSVYHELARTVAPSRRD
ncbi:MAG: DUF695 domain-containing protein [Thermoanaerobaculia bacterium]